MSNTQKIDDGGPAFPVPSAFIPAPEGSSSMFTNTNEYGAGPTPGMSIRDYFAAKALSALVQKAPLMDAEGEHGPKFDKSTLTQFRYDMAVSAYDYADAMLAARAEGGAP